MTLAVEAARIIQEEGLTDFRAAKAKAAERLGLGRNAPLPDNAEIEAALAERTRIFYGATQPALLAALRQAAFEVMHELAGFHPRLVGDVLSGSATPHSAVDLPLVSDTAESVGAALEVDDIRPPRPGVEMTLWAFVGVVPYVRVGILSETGGFFEAGLMIKLPARTFR